MSDSFNLSANLGPLFELKIISEENLTLTVGVKSTSLFAGGGERGPIGPNGLQGIQGEQGPQGIQGIQGEQGPVGPQGEDGTNFTISEVGLLINKSTYDSEPEGFSYLASDTGDLYIMKAGGVWSLPLPFKGPKGDTGNTGADGLKGDTGDQGIQGIQGVKGDQGDQGIQGIQGIKGDKGDTGDIGPAGDSDPQYNISNSYVTEVVISDSSYLNNRVLLCYGSDPINVTVSSVDFPNDVNSPVVVVQMGTGQLTFSGSLGTDLISADSAFKTRAQYSVCTVIMLDATTYLVVGDLVV